MNSIAQRDRVNGRSMRDVLNRIGKSYLLALERSIRYIRPHIPIILTLAAVITPLFYVIDLMFKPTFDTLVFRVIGGLACIVPIYFIRVRASEFAINMSSIITATLLLMWMFPAMLMVNAATVPEGGTMHYYWICMYLLAIMLYVQFVSNFLVSFTGWAVGFLGAVLCISMVEEPNMESVIQNGVYPFTIYLTAIVFSNLINRHVETVERDKTEAAKAIGGNIAHELRTPLSGINSRATALERLLPEFAEVYVLAADAGLVRNPLPKNQIQVFKESAKDIKAEANYSNTVISMLLINTAEDRFKDIEFDTFSVSSVIDDAIERYPFPNNKEMGMVSVAGDLCNEVIRAPKLLVEHILFNLLKNALFHCQDADKGVIEVSGKVTKEGALLIVRDTGPGIPADVLPKIFDRFFTTSPMGRGSGIGLNFCRNVMNDLGGSIRCRSTEGEFSEFTVVFPVEVKQISE